jgi:DHA3 family tetracycline resistance protein-like MFS transporter
MNPLTVYLILEFVAALYFSLIFTVSQLYYVSTVQLNPLQLVLVGTVLEATVFLFEIPTGVLADVKSRRLSVILGYALMGVGFVVEGAFPYFATVALAQVLWGFGYTFTSGATQAWVADELGEERAGHAFLRGAQAAPAGALVAIPLSVLLGGLSLRLPIILGGVLMILLALFLVLVMTEEGFVPTPPQERTTWRMMLRTGQDAQYLVRRQPILLALLGTSFFYGLYSEGFDRLWTPHLLDNFQASWQQSVQPVVWFGLIRAGMLLISLVTTELARRRVDIQRPLPLAGALLVNASLIILSLAGFALVKTFWLAIVLYWLIGALRNIAAPLHAAWFNLNIDDSQVRATLFSVSGQADAIGQIVGGPGVGAIGNRSLRTALLSSAALLTPVLPLYGVVLRQVRMREGTQKAEHLH